MSKLATVKIDGASEASEKLRGLIVEIELNGDGTASVCGCHPDEEEDFFEAILEIDKITGEHGFETIDDVEAFWMESDEILRLPKTDFVIL